MSAVKILFDYTTKIFSMLFSPNSNLVSEEFSDIMDNKKDKENYLEAIEKARENKREERVKLSSGEILVVAP